MVRLRHVKTVRKNVALSDVFEAFVQTGEPTKRSIGFGVFDTTGTMIDRLLAKLPEAAAPRNEQDISPKR